MTTPLLDSSVKALWDAEAAAGRPPPFAMFVELELGLAHPWWHAEAIGPLLTCINPTSHRKSLVAIEATRSGGKSTLLAAFRLWLCSYVIPYLSRPGLPLQAAQRQICIFGRDERNIRDDQLGPMAHLIIERMPWLRTNDWKTLVEDIENPTSDGLRALSDLKSKGQQKWEALRLDLSNGVSIRTRTLRQSVRGLHTFYCDMDDILTESNAHESAEIRGMIQGAILPALEAGGLLLLTGTPQQPGDIFDLCKDDPDWSYRAYPAIDLDGSLGYAAKNPPHTPQADIHCLWPERLSMAALDQARGSTPESNVKFAREMLLERITDTTSLIRPDDLLTSRDESLSYEHRATAGRRYGGGCDPSGRKKDAAGFAIGWVRPDTVRILSSLRKLEVAPHLPDGEGELSVVQELNDLSIQFQCFDWTVEGNGAQSVLLPLARQMNPSIRPKKFMLGANKHTVEGWLGMRTIWRNRLIKVPYATEEDRRITDELFHQLRGLQFIDGKIVEDRRRPNDLASAIFLFLKDVEEVAAVYSATGLVARPSIDTEAVASTIALPGAPSQSIFDRPRHGGELSPNSPREQSLFDRMYRHTRR